MNIISKFIQKRLEANKKRNIQNMSAEIKESVQIREFNGIIYLSFKNIPLIKASDLKGDICDAVETVRNNVYDYKVYQNKI